MPVSRRVAAPKSGATDLPPLHPNTRESLEYTVQMLRELSKLAQAQKQDEQKQDELRYYLEMASMVATEALARES